MKDSYKSEYFIDSKKRRALNIKLAKHIKLTFEPNDVKFIIVERDSEIPDMIKKLDDIFGKTASSNDLKLLGTRLISLEQILENLLGKNQYSVSASVIRFYVLHSAGRLTN